MFDIAKLTAFFDKKVTDFKIYVDNELIRMGKKLTSFYNHINGNLTTISEDLETLKNNPTIQVSKQGKKYLTIKNINPVNKYMKSKLSYINLIGKKFENKTETVNGVTFTTNSDGTITVNGTATENTNYVLVNAILNPDTDYVFSGGINGNTNNTFWLSFNGSFLTMDRTDDYIIPAVKQQFNAILSFNINSGVTVNNISFKPCLEIHNVSEITDWSYLEPDFDVDYSKVNFEVYTKNLLNTRRNVSQTIGGITYSIDEIGQVHISGESTNSSGTTIFLSGDVNNKINFEVKENMTLSGNSSGITGLQLLAKITPTQGVTMPMYPSDNGLGARINKGCTVDYFYISIAKGVKIDGEIVISPQLEFDDAEDGTINFTSFEPYNKQTFTPDSEGFVNNIIVLSDTMTMITDAEYRIDCRYLYPISYFLNN